MATWVEPHPGDRFTFFSSADSGSEHRLFTQFQFDESLIYNVLFSNGLVISDASLFSSAPLLRHLRAARVSFFDRALDHGLIVPAFRDGAVTTFREAAASLHDLRGVMRNEMAELAERFDRATKDRAARVRLDWPPAVGEAFAETISDAFAQQRPPLAGAEVLELWEESAQWRAIALDHGRRLTEEVGGAGIRRAEMINALGHHLGVLDRREAFVKPGDMITRLPPEQQRLASFVIDVINVCHQRNQAAMLSRPDAHTVLHNVPAVLADAASAVLGERVSASSSRPESLTLELQVPTVESLLRADTRDVLAVRRADAGARFHAASDAWLRHGGSERADELREAARLYGDALAAVAKGSGRRARFRLDRRLVKVATPSVASTGISLGLQAMTDAPAPVYTLIAAGAGLAASTFFAFRPEPRVPRTAFDLALARPMNVEQSLWAGPNR